MTPARLFALGATLLCAGLSCSPDRGPGIATHASLPLVSVTNVPTPEPGAFSILKLGNDAAAEQSNVLVRLRHFPKQAGLEARAFTEAQGPRHSIRYLLFKPATNQTAPLPLVLSLHGGGPRQRFEDLLEPYAPGFAYGLGRLVSPETQREHPCYVIAPWSNNRGWDDDHLRVILALLDSLQAEFKTDPARVYVTGQSMGGFGTWSIIAVAPQRFAAAIPICGGGEPASAPRIKTLPIWAFHGSSDGVVPVYHTRDIIHALRQAGGQPIYWEYQGATHAETAERAYCEPELIRWLFLQRR